MARHPLFNCFTSFCRDAPPSGTWYETLNWLLPRILSHQQSIAEVMQLILHNFNCYPVIGTICFRQTAFYDHNLKSNPKKFQYICPMIDQVSCCGPTRFLFGRRKNRCNLILSRQFIWTKSVCRDRPESCLPAAGQSFAPIFCQPQHHLETISPPGKWKGWKLK